MTSSLLRRYLVPPLSRPHILLAEDNDFNRQLAAAILEDQGYRVTVAEDGERALALFREQRFELILMDVAMPVMDGCAATRAIRATEQAEGRRTRTPIIALTATADAEDRQACLESGMDDVLLKPFSAQGLQESLARCRREAGAGGDAAGRKCEHPEAAPGVPNLPGALLSDRILADFSANPQRLALFFDLLCHDLGTQLAAMKRAQESGDQAALRDAAHAAKGVAQGLRDQSLSRLAEEIEQQARQGDLSGVRKKLSEMAALYGAVNT